jgi:hypothetical protein
MDSKLGQLYKITKHKLMEPNLKPKDIVLLAKGKWLRLIQEKVWKWDSSSIIEAIKKVIQNFPRPRESKSSWIHKWVFPDL